MSKVIKGVIAVAVIGAVGVLGTNWYLGKQLKEAIAQQQQELAIQGMALSYSDASVNALTHSWIVSGISFKGPQGDLFKVAEVSSNNFDMNQVQPHSLAEFSGLELSPELLQEAPAELKDALGKVKLHGRLESHYDASKGTFESSTLLDDKSLGEVEMQFSTAGATPFIEFANQYSQKLKNNPPKGANAERELLGQMMPKLQQMVINNVSLRVKDGGLLDLFYRLRAADTGLDKTNLQQQLGQQVAMNPLLTDAQRQTLQDFFQGGHELTIKASPSEQLSVGEMMTPAFQQRFSTPQQLLHFLGLTFNGNGFEA